MMYDIFLSYNNLQHGLYANNCATKESIQPLCTFN